MAQLPYPLQGELQSADAAISGSRHELPPRRGRRELILLLLVAVVVICASVALWRGMGWYARWCWDTELSRLKASGRALSDSDYEFQKEARLAREYPEALCMSRAGSFIALFPEPLRETLFYSNGIRENYLVQATVTLQGIRSTPENGICGSIDSYFQNDGYIHNFAGMVRMKVVRQEDLRKIALLPVDMRTLCAWTKKELIEHILDAVRAAEMWEASSPSITWEQWYLSATGDSRMPLAYRFGPTDMFYLAQRDYIRELNRLLTLVENMGQSRFVPRPRFTGNQSLVGQDSITMQGLGVMLNFTCGAVCSNMQRLIVAYAQFRHEHQRNPTDMKELVKSANLQDVLLETEGASLVYETEGNDPNAAARLTCVLDKELRDYVVQYMNMLEADFSALDMSVKLNDAAQH
ncbi:MAG: hypothetical protein ACAI35_16460 [Candidatus Methylacidiphilales bacterium]